MKSDIKRFNAGRARGRVSVLALSVFPPVLAGLALTAPLASTAFAQAREQGTTLTWSLAQEPPNWNYWQVGATALTGPVFHNILQPIVERGPDGSALPLLAESWDISEDGLTYTFQLREAKFHDGSDLDAADVVYSILKNKESPVGDIRAPLASVAGVEAVDPRTVRITLEKPSQRLMSELGLRSGIIVPEGFFENFDAAIQVIGTGPYRFGSYNPDVSLTLTRFDEYWGEEPHFETIVHRFISDETSAINALLSSELDMIITVQGEGLDRVQSVTNRGGFETWEPGPIGINYMFLSTKVEAFKDIRVRQAIAHAIDRESVILGAVGGYGQPICETVVPASVTWNADYCPYPYDLDKARALLAEAGHSDLTIDFPYTTVAEHPVVRDIVEASLTEIGITVNARAMDLATWLAQVNTDGQYDISNITAGAKAEAYVCGGGRQPLGRPDSEECLPEFDELAALSDTITDPAEYEAAMQRMVRELAESAWVIPIFAKLPPALVRDDLEGFKAHRMLMEMDARNLRWK